MASSRHPTWPLPLEAGRQTSAWANVLDDSHLPRVLTHVEALKSEVTESPIQEVVSPVEKAVNRYAAAFRHIHEDDSLSPESVLLQPNGMISTGLATCPGPR